MFEQPRLRHAVATALGLSAAVVLAGVHAPAMMNDAASDDRRFAASKRINHKPAWLRVMKTAELDGASDDLLTAGVGLDVLLGTDPIPGYADPAKPTAAELRRAALAIRFNQVSGAGVLYGANFDAAGNPIGGPGKIAGTEILAYADDGGGRHNAAMLLQIPASFDQARGCILAVPVNGSARLYVDVLRIGAWGLRRNCAVVYTDKGQGNGVHDLESDTVLLIDGATANAAEVGRDAHFRAPLSDPKRRSFLAEHPDRIAFKHAHSRQNADATWGRDVLRSIHFAIYALNERFGEPLGDGAMRRVRYDRANTVVIVSGDSNGGGAALKAGEADREGLIDGIVASQPQIQPVATDKVVIQRAGEAIVGGGRSLVDYFTYGIIYQPCAVLATPDAPFANQVAFAADRCRSLHEKGLLRADSLVEQARESLEKLHEYGWEPGSDPQQALSFVVAPGATANKYANAQGRFGVEDRLCGYSIANTDAEGRPIPASPEQLATIWVSASGGAPVGSIDLINDNDPSGPRRDTLSISPSTGRQDYNLDGALCMRDLVTGDSGEARRVQRGIAEVRAGGDLRGVPTLIVHGREDARVPTNFSSRPYLGLNSLVEGPRSGLRYVEVTNAGHFGAGVPFDHLLVPLDYYAEQARTAMWNHLTAGAPLPAHQVVRTIARGGQSGSAPPLTLENLPPFVDVPSSGDEITVFHGVVTIPD